MMEGMKIQRKAMIHSAGPGLYPGQRLCRFGIVRDGYKCRTSRYSSRRGRGRGEMNGAVQRTDTGARVAPDQGKMHVVAMEMKDVKVRQFAED